MGESGIPGPSRFGVTSWTLLGLLHDEARRAEAEEAIVQIYWRPILLYLRRRGFDRETAKDWTQEFFTRAFEQAWFKKAGMRKGRFRGFLLTLLRHFVHDTRDRAQQKFENRILLAGTGENDETLLDPREDETPESAFLRQWVSDLVGRVHQTLIEKYQAAPDAWAFEIFQERVLAASDGRNPTWAELAARHGKTLDQVRYAYTRVQEHSKTILRELLEAEGDDPESDLTELLDLIRG